MKNFDEQFIGVEDDGLKKTCHPYQVKQYIEDLIKEMVGEEKKRIDEWDTDQDFDNVEKDGYNDKRDEIIKVANKYGFLIK